jgi:hypothetical protein
MSAILLDTLKDADLDNQLTDNSDRICRLCSAMCWLSDRGFEVKGPSPPELPWIDFKKELKSQKPESAFHYAFFQTPDLKDGWVKLPANLDITCLSKAVISGGRKALRDAGVPVLKIDGLTIVGKTEREQCRTVANQLSRYAREWREGRSDRPLSIAVFGAPGSGKSSMVRAMIESIDVKHETVTFNLSQFESPDELARMFHKIGNIGLRGNLPFVFWDEFDSECGGKKNGWLRYFLSAMEDGKFRDGSEEFDTGPCVFIFAGGTSSTFADFQRKRVEGIDDNAKAQKLPDFVSRLSGYLDIPDINPPTGDQVPSDDWKIRRALVLNHFIGKCWPHKMPRITEEALEILLHRKAKNGARSLRSVIEQSDHRQSVVNVGALPLDLVLDQFLEKPGEQA